MLRRMYSPVFLTDGSERMISGRRFRTRLAAVLFGIHCFRRNYVGIKKH